MEEVLPRCVALEVPVRRLGGGRPVFDLAVATDLHAVLEQAAPGGAALAAPAHAQPAWRPACRRAGEYRAAGIRLG